MRTAALLLCMSLPISAGAQEPPSFEEADPRIRSIDFRPDQVVTIEAAPGYQVTIELAPDEAIRSAAIGDSTAWQVSASKAGNRLFVKPTQAGVATNLSVFTDVRSYTFDLSSVEGGSPPYTVRFRYGSPAPSSSQRAATPTEARRYRLRGDRMLQPVAMHDDGIHTYIEWKPDAPLPATYSLDQTGREVLANGNMREGLYVLDGVSERLVFRIDRRVARATRLRPEKPNRQ